MSLWGNSDADEAKPKWLTAADKKLTYATASGWVYKKSDNHQEEVIAAIQNLATSIGQADIVAIDWVSTAFDKSDGGTLSATVDYDAPKFQADDIDLNIFETQTYDIMPSIESHATLTSFNSDLPANARDLDISSSSSDWYSAYAGMVAKEENTKEFIEWSN